mmetsp:Transcript_43023/g.113857  ORF Transcript_43023/g.113857 Transcript_43023/m.113857 type:complete len:269 (-) Transcript_43023:338-1144(-)
MVLDAPWRVEVAFFLVKLLYALTALPFLIFKLPWITLLLSHVYPTGYDRGGRCVPLDPGGLSAYLDWLESLLSRSDIASQLGEAVPSGGRGATLTKLEKLQGAAEAARCELLSGLSARAKDRMRDEIDQLLKLLLPKQHPLHELFHPNLVLCEAYDERMAAEKAERRAESARQRKERQGRTYEEQQAAKFGNWQPDSEAHQCHVCQKPFNLFRRKHHCRMCGFIVCDACSTARRPVGDSASVERVCDKCVDAADAREDAEVNRAAASK